MDKKVFLIELMGERKFLTKQEIDKLKRFGFEIKVLEELSELEIKFINK